MVSFKIDSANIKLFPSSKRSTQHDRNARIPSESNLTSMVSRLTIPCFTINGLGLNSTGNYILEGSFNMLGYIFYVTDIEIPPEFKSNNSSGDLLTFKISITPNNAFNSSSAHDYLRNVNDGGADDDGGDIYELDSDSLKFNGLKITKLPKDNNLVVNGLQTYYLDQLDDGTMTCYLVIGMWNGTQYITFKTDDGTSDGTQANKVKFKASDIQLSLNRQDANLERNEPTKNELTNYNIQDLQTYLRYNIIIDGGEV